MKKIYTSLFFCFLLTELIAQTNFEIEYDLMNNTTKYYQLDWVKGKQIKSETSSIKLAQNDIVSVKVINVNNFVYAIDIKEIEIEIENRNNQSSPFGTILSVFSGMGGPATKLLTSLGANAPQALTASRGETKEVTEYKEKCMETILEMNKLMSDMISIYAEYEKNVKIKFSKIKTKEEILADLRLVNGGVDVTMLEESKDRLTQLTSLFDDLMTKEILEEDDPFWEELAQVEDHTQDFNDICIDEEGNLKPYSLSDVISEVENASFMVEHRFLAKAESNYGSYISNDFLILIKEIKAEIDDPTNYPIVNAKYISVPIKKPNAPYWTVGVDFVMPVGGIKDFAVSNIDGDFLVTPDSLLITEASNKMTQLAIGTKLNFDVPVKNRFITPQIIAGMAISVLNQDRDQWKLNVLIGSGFSFKRFPYIGFNTGLVLNQQKVLREEFVLNRTFAKPENYNPGDAKVLFKTTMKPGLFFGINIRI